MRGRASEGKLYTSIYVGRRDKLPLYPLVRMDMRDPRGIDRQDLVPGVPGRHGLSPKSCCLISRPCRSTLNTHSYTSYQLPACHASPCPNVQISSSSWRQYPNLLILISRDDHAAKSISCYGADINSTPNLDRIAHDGMRFDHCYVTNSICTPSRATILTGTHNHTNLVYTLDSKIDKQLPNVAKQLRGHGGYTTAIIGKWHLGEGKAHEPSGFDYWDVIPGQGNYFDPEFINPQGHYREKGYATDIITDKTIQFIKDRPKDKPFFAMCHHKAPHRSWECDPKHRSLYTDDIAIPDTFDDDYKNRAKAAEAAKMRVEMDMTYFDLGLAQPDGGDEVGPPMVDGPGWSMIPYRKVPSPEDVTTMRPLIDHETGEAFTFKTKAELKKWKYQRYMKRYLRTIQWVWCKTVLTLARSTSMSAVCWTIWKKTTSRKTQWSSTPRTRGFS